MARNNIMESLANSEIRREENDRKRKKKEAEDGMDHFQMLPSELVVQIFDKVSEVKWLCMCYLVSSRFASLVLQTRSVSFKLNGSRPGRSLEIRGLFVMVINFLIRFVSIQSLHVEVLFGESPEGGVYDHYITKWKAIGYPKSFILLAAKRVIATADNDDKPKVGATVEMNESQFSVDKIYSLVSKISSHANDSDMRYDTLAMIVDSLPNLKEAVVTDSLNQGRLLVREADLDIMRKSVQCGTYIRSPTKLWRQPVLKLPGFVMEDAILVIVKCMGIDDVCIAENAFEEKEFCEAATEMLKEKPHFSVHSNTILPRDYTFLKWISHFGL